MSEIDKVKASHHGRMALVYAQHEPLAGAARRDAPIFGRDSGLS